MRRQSERLRNKNMADKKQENSECHPVNKPDGIEEDSECDASVSEGDTAILENSLVDELKEEIRSLKEAYKMLLERTSLSPSAKAPLSHQSVDMPHSVTPQPTTAPCNVFMPPNCNKISIDKTISNTYIPNVSLPYYSHTYMPPHSTQAYRPLSSAHNNPLPSQSLQNYTSLSCIQNFMPPQSTQTFTSTSTRPTSGTTSTFSSAGHATPFPNTQLFNEYRPIRKLHDLPEFNGQPEQWPMFSVSYRETTQNYNYTNLENLTRLQKALKGNAKAKVEAYLIHPENVNQVMSTLEFHYGRPQIMIRTQISKVRAFPPINKLYEITNFSSMVTNLIVFLENAGATPHLSNPTLLDELINKLPLAKREEWMKYSYSNLGQYPSVKEFGVWLQEVAMYISLAAEIDINKIESSSAKRDKVKSSFAITTNKIRQPNCLKCKQNHYLNQCTKFKNSSTEERWQFVKDNRLCFSCLHAGHNTLNCNNRRQCGLMKCTKYHNRFLHENKNPITKNINNENIVQCQVNNDGTLETVDTNGSKYKTAVTTIIGHELNKRTLFKFLPVQLKGPKGFVNVIAFIDDGSKISLVEEKVVRQLGLQGPKSNLSLGWIGGKTSNEMSAKVNLEITNMDENKCTYQMKNVRTTKNLLLPSQSLHIEKFKSSFPILNEIVIGDYFDATPKLLIGLPHASLVRPLSIINLDEHFSVHRTKLGNTLFGSNEESVETTVAVINFKNFDNVQQQISEYFTLESFGMKAVDPVISEDDKRAEEILARTTVKTDLHYETGLLWKQNDFNFKDSFSIALKRLHGVEAKMKKDNDLANWYKEKINEHVSKSYARKLSPEEAAIENACTWYLPHFVVTNANKGNKRRLVFDAAALVDGESFNSRLLKGPAKYQPKPLLAILFKFRQCRIGVCADIREMFHRIRIREEDQTAQRFLWRDGDSSKPPEIYVMQAMIFGSASSPCSAQYVKNLNAKTHADSESRAYKAIVECHYVDDYVDSFNTINEAVSVAKNVISIHAQAGFELRGFVSNSTDFLRSITGKDSVNNDLKITGLPGNEKTTEKNPRNVLVAY